MTKRVNFQALYNWNKSVKFTNPSRLRDLSGMKSNAGYIMYCQGKHYFTKTGLVLYMVKHYTFYTQKSILRFDAKSQKFISWMMVTLISSNWTEYNSSTLWCSEHDQINFFLKDLVDLEDFWTTIRNWYCHICLKK